MNLEQIREHWERSGETFPHDTSVTPTSRDPYLGELERANILDHLSPAATTLELGCGDAFHTVHYARRVERLFATDLASSLVELASRRTAQEGLTNVAVSACSVLDIEERFRSQRFDRIISQRCLINLPGWSYQKDALLQAHHLLKDDGLFLLTEGFQENLDRLNGLREEFGLAAIKVVDYNCNIPLGEFEAFVSEHFEVVDKRHYGFYAVLSRVFHPMVVWPDPPQHNARLNEVAMRLARALPTHDLEPYSYPLFYALRKRS